LERICNDAGFATTHKRVLTSEGNRHADLVKIVPNSKSGKTANTFLAVLDTFPNVPERDRIYKDCPNESCIIILCS